MSRMSSLLPFYLCSGALRHKSKLYKEKHLILTALLICVLTIFVILMNLPSDAADLNKQLDADDIQRQQKQQHQQEQQHSQDSAGTNSSSDRALSVSEMREKIREMTLFAWRNYEKYAFGDNELRPLSRVGHSAGIFGSSPTRLGATIVDGLDTIYLMGYTDEYERGRAWIAANLNLNVDTDYSAFEINIRFIGGLLSLYTLTKDRMYLDKAEQIATLLLPIFETPTGIPYALINPISKRAKNYNWASGSCSILSEFGTLSLEFTYLSDLTGNGVFAAKVERVYEALRGVEREEGLYYNYLSPQTGKWCLKHASMGALGDSFYEYLLKLWLYKGRRTADAPLLRTYADAMSAVRRAMVHVSEPSGLTYLAEIKSGRVEKKMDHLACFSAGLFALGAKQVGDQHGGGALLDASVRAQHMQLAANLTHTCHESYVRTTTRIGPESFHFERADQEAQAIKSSEMYYILRPEVIEAYFYMWRLTKDERYRAWAWDAALAIERHCRTEHGFSGLKNVYDAQTERDDVQQSFFFAETLKYLFLIFSDDTVLPLDKYVFNTEAHPFLIKTDPTAAAR